MIDSPGVRPLPWLALTILLTIVLTGLTGAGSAQAQLMHMDPLPFFTPADSTSRLALVVDLDRTNDDKFGWTMNRIMLTAFLPAGDDAAFFLRLPHQTFDSGEVPVRSRWPWLMGPDGQDGWPGESRISSFGKLEIGVTGPIVLPLLRGMDYGLALGLPSGTDRVYPFSSQSIPLRLQLRKPVVLSHGLQAGLLAGYLVHMDSGKDFLDSSAFPSGYQLGASLARYGGRGSRWHLTWDYRNEDNRKSQLVGVQGWVPWTDDGAVGLKIAREIQGSLDRPAEWYFTLSWRFDSPKYRQGLEDKPTINQKSAERPDLQPVGEPGDGKSRDDKSDKSPH
jgi:hypothetical protein